MFKKPDRTHLGHKQRAVIEDLLKGLNKYEALAKNKVSPCRYKQWLKNAVFRREFNARVDSMEREQKCIILNSAPHAARRLIELMNSEKDEVARKACVDIINIRKADALADAEDKAKRQEQESHQPKMSHAKAAKIWAIMAEPDEPETPAENPVSQETPQINSPNVQIVQTPVSFDQPHVQPENKPWFDKYQDYDPNNQYSFEPEKPPVTIVMTKPSPEVLRGAAACGITPALLATAFPFGPPQDFLDDLLEVAKSPGSNPDREHGLRVRAEEEASANRRNRRLGRC